MKSILPLYGTFVRRFGCCYYLKQAVIQPTRLTSVTYDATYDDDTKTPAKKLFTSEPSLLHVKPSVRVQPTLIFRLNSFSLVSTPIFWLTELLIFNVIDYFPIFFTTCWLHFLKNFIFVLQLLINCNLLFNIPSYSLSLHVAWWLINILIVFVLLQNQLEKVEIVDVLADYNDSSHISDDFFPKKNRRQKCFYDFCHLESTPRQNTMDEFYDDDMENVFPYHSTPSIVAMEKIFSRQRSPSFEKPKGYISPLRVRPPLANKIGTVGGVWWKMTNSY